MLRKKHRVPLHGKPNGYVEIDAGATEGAVVGENLRWPDGALVDAAALRGAMQPPGPGGATITYWRLIQEIPPHVVALAETTTTGLYVITGDGASATRAIQPVAGETTVSNGDGVAGNPVVGLADVADSGSGALLAITRDAKGRVSGTKAATITGTAGQIEVANGDAIAGLPTISLADVTPTPGGTLQRYGFDAKGRRSEEEAADTDDLAEGSANLYFTAARVRDTLLTGLSLASSAVISATDSVLSAFGKLQAQITALASSVSGLVVQTITSGDTTHAPSGDAVFDALEGKAPLLRPQFLDWVGIGKAADRPLTIASDTSTLPPGTSVVLLEGDGNKERIEARSSGGGDPTFQGKASMGTLASPSALALGESLVTLAGSGHNGVDWQIANKALIRAVASEDWSASGMGCYWAIATTENGSTSFAYRWRFDGSGPLLPWVDNAYTVGDAASRIKELFCANGTINTSDAREKTEPRDLTETELACAADLARLPSMFQWLHAIEEKGEGARLHCSPTVQSVIATMEAHGLDPFRYGFVCYDEWDETPEVKDEETGEVTQEHRPAGDRYSLRPCELQFFIARGQEERLRRIEQALGL